MEEETQVLNPEMLEHYLNDLLCAQEEEINELYDRYYQ